MYALFQKDEKDQLAEIARGVSITLLRYDKELKRIKPEDFLPRYNELDLKITNGTNSDLSQLIVTVRRTGTKIADDNYYTVPLNTPELRSGSTCRYRIMSFDSFNLPFNDIFVSVASFDEMSKRQLSAKHLERARELTKFQGAD